MSYGHRLSDIFEEILSDILANLKRAPLKSAL
ncbi:hypothetical protein ICS_05641 [Bacillus cereus BAG2O-3]|nr:hypothetical protein ICS_05641 [Bacillus cereus BAG2O-3]